jgi:hypothetical protein
MKPACLLLPALLLLAPPGPISGATNEPAKVEAVWLLSEFDWGDVRPVVDESIDVAPDLYCAARFGSRCSMAVADVEGEELLAKFEFSQGLYRIRLLTPDIEVSILAPAEQRAADEEILRRVWKHLVDFVTRHKGAPLTEREFPELGTVSFGMRPTHTWKLSDQDIRVGVGRRRGGGFYVVAEFVDPEREAAARKAGGQASTDTARRKGSSPPAPAD